MTPKQILELRQGAIRRELATLAAAEATDETRASIATLLQEATDVSLKVDALTVADDTPVEVRQTDTAAAEHDALITRAAGEGGLGHIYNAAMGRALPQGATAELQQSLGLGPTFIPLELLGSGRETRAAATITGDTQGEQQSVLGTVFAASVSEFMGIQRPVVPVGVSIWPVLTTGATAGRPAKSAAQAESTAVLTSYDLKPRALQASVRYTREDAAIFPTMAESLREELEGALMEELDDFNINDSTADFEGIIAALTNPTNPTATATFADYIGLVFGAVDGKYAVAEGDVRVLMPSASYTQAAGIYRGGSSDLNVVEVMRRASGGVRMTSHIADHASDQTILVRKGLRSDFVSPIWQGVEVVVDEVTAAGNREVILTAYLLAQHKMLRTGGFSRHELQST